LLQTNSWTTDLDKTIYGGWQWQVSVLSGGNVVTTSLKQDFQISPVGGTPPPAPVAASRPAASPELIAPQDGGGPYRNPITFQWRGALGPGQSYRVVVYSRGGLREVGISAQSELLTTTRWTANLPDRDNLGNSSIGALTWQVSVMDGNVAVASSPRWGLMFDPLNGKPQPTE
jgi:hypothetical protein